MIKNSTKIANKNDILLSVYLIYVMPIMSNKRSQELVVANHGERGLQGFYKIDELRNMSSTILSFSKRITLVLV